MNQTLLRFTTLLIGFYLIGLGLSPMTNWSAASNAVFTAGNGDFGASAVVAPAKGTSTLLPEGTRITVQLYEDISSRDLSADRLVQWVVYKDVRTAGEPTVLIAAGAWADGKVRFARRAGVFGRPGRMAVDVTTVDAVDGQRIPVYCKPLDVQGKDRRALAWCLGIGLCIVGLVIIGSISSSTMVSGPLFLLAVLPMFLGLFISGKDIALQGKSTLIEVTVQRDMMIKA